LARVRRTTWDVNAAAALVRTAGAHQAHCRRGARTSTRTLVCLNEKNEGSYYIS